MWTPIKDAKNSGCPRFQLVDAKVGVQHAFELGIVGFYVRHILPNDVFQALRDFTAVQPNRNKLRDCHKITIPI